MENTANDFLVKPVLLEGDEPLSKALSLLKNQKEGSHVLITKDGKYAGIIDDRLIRRFQGNAETTKVSKLAHTAKKLSRESSAEQIVEGFLNSEVKVLPVLDGDRLLGVVPRSAALKILSESNAMTGKRVADWMTRPAITVTEDTTIAEAEHTMVGHGLFWLAVVDKRGRLAGVVTTYDIATKVKPSGKASRREATFSNQAQESVNQEAVANVMSNNPITISPKATVKEALGVMLANGVSNLVVVEGDKPIGVFSSRDAMEIVATVPRQNVFIYGLRADEKMLQQSLVDEVSAFTEKIGRSAPVDYVVLHLRSTSEGQKRRYQARARVCINGHLHLASTPDIDPHRRIWDASMAVKEVLDEVEKVFYKHDKRKPGKDRADRGQLEQEDEEE